MCGGSFDATVRRGYGSRGGGGGGGGDGAGAGAGAAGESRRPSTTGGADLGGLNAEDTSGRRSGRLGEHHQSPSRGLLRRLERKAVNADADDEDADDEEAAEARPATYTYIHSTVFN